MSSAYLQLKSGKATIFRNENKINIIGNSSVEIGDVIECDGECKLIIDSNKIIVLKKVQKLRLKREMLREFI